MKLEELNIGGIYHYPINNIFGYEEYCYTGQTHPSPNGGFAYCFQGRSGREGYYWFDAQDIAQMTCVGIDKWYKLMYDAKNTMK